MGKPTGFLEYKRENAKVLGIPVLRLHPFLKVAEPVNKT